MIDYKYPSRVDFLMDNTLAHHGIKGQEWGKRNGPPYPLDSEGKKEFQENREREEELEAYREEIERRNEKIKKLSKKKNKFERKANRLFFNDATHMAKNNKKAKRKNAKMKKEMQEQLKVLNEYLIELPADQKEAGRAYVNDIKQDMMLEIFF